MDVKKIVLLGAAGFALVWVGRRVVASGDPAYQEAVSLVTEPIYFDYDSTRVNQEGQVRLNRLAMIIRDRPEIKLRVVGYADSNGSDEYNQALSVRRAQAVVTWMVSSLGVSQDVFSSVEGRGESNPVASNDTDEGRALNRRVELEVM